jgi:hypothetical protein
MEDEVAKAIKTQSNMHTLGVWLETIGHLVGTNWEHGENTKKPKRISKAYYPCHVPPRREKNNGWVHLVSNKLGYVHSFEPLYCIALCFRVIIKSSCLWALVWAWKPNSYPSLVHSQQHWRREGWRGVRTCCWRWNWRYNAHDWSFTFEHDKIAPV